MPRVNIGENSQLVIKAVLFLALDIVKKNPVQPIWGSVYRRSESDKNCSLQILSKQVNLLINDAESVVSSISFPNSPAQLGLDAGTDLRHVIDLLSSEQMIGTNLIRIEDNKGRGKRSKGCNFTFHGLPSLNWQDCEQAIQRSIDYVNSGYQSKDTLAIEVRAKIAGVIREECGLVRVLDMPQPISLDDIFTEVYVLEDIEGRRRLTVPQLLDICRVENFDLIGVDRIRQTRLSGLEVVQRHSKLLVFGKPGSGKTTFLKRLAMLCIREQPYFDFVPIFVTLRDFAEEPEKPTLVQYVAQKLAACGVDESEKVVKALLSQGKILALLDALDEVREDDISRVLKQIRIFSRDSYNCQCIITCRIASRAYVFEQFTEVEIADFSNDQIKAFADNWFTCHNDSEKSVRFWQKLNADKSIKELATNPLMLTLLCSVFSENFEFPVTRSELYEEGLNIWLEKWDKTRAVERQEIYKNLPRDRKKDLLSYLAFRTFTENKYFFKQTDAEQLIAAYIQNIPVIINELNEARSESEVLLEAIQSQHGLLVERAKGVYSFSHLTFHEYFAARYIYRIQDAAYLESLSTRVIEPLWRDVFLLTFSMLQNSDLLVRFMKQKIDSLISEQRFVQFFDWLDSKARSVLSDYDLATIRAYYFASENAFSRNSKLILDLDLALAIDKTFSLAFNEVSEIALDRSLVLLLDTISSLHSALTQETEPNIIFTLSRDFEIVLARNIVAISDIELNRAVSLEHADNSNSQSSICDVIKLAVRQIPIDTANQMFKQALEELLSEITAQCCNSEQPKQWLQEHGDQWIEKFRQTLIHHRNIGYKWQFSDEEIKVLKHFLGATKLLVECINSDCYISREIRDKVTSAILIPSSMF